MGQVMNALGALGLVSSTIYVAQVATQVKVYGFRRWWEYGLGTGVEIHPPAEVDEET